MSKPNNTNTTQPSYIPPSLIPDSSKPPSSILLARGVRSLNWFADNRPRLRVKERPTKKFVEKFGPIRRLEKQRIPYTAVESPPQSTPNDKELIELEQETAAPWVTGKKAIEQSKRTREQLEEDEILQEVLEEEAAIARLTEAAKNQEPIAGTSKRIRLIVGSTPDTEEDINTGRRYKIP
ncbi:hypothetical protein H4Q26_017883 [Puccinia striiformis f. sp. tritici PST-130]|nr:hypothetical protein H4Q26_017883 [Puccinia striiformis f. sp. tritici PST-130]